MICTVQNVRGQNPEEWLSKPNNVYAGRWQRIRSGRYAGQDWPESGLGNPYKFLELDRIDERRYKLFLFLKHLRTQLDENPAVRQIFKSLPGKNLGCWCVTWDAISGTIPFCHSAWLAEVVNRLADVRVVSVTVSSRGHFFSYMTPIGEPSLTYDKLDWVTFEQKWLI